MTTDTTPEDVQPVDDTQASVEPQEAVTPEVVQEVQAEPETQLSEREAKLEAIAAKRLAEQMPQAEPTPEPVAEVEEPEAEPEEVKARHKIKVDGEEIDLTFEEMRALAQKGKAADKRFQEASELSKTSAQRIKELEEKLAQQSSTSLPSDGTQQSALPTDGPLEFTADTIDQAVYAGDENGQKAREELARRLNQKPTDPSEIKAQIRLEMRVEQAIDNLSKADPIAGQMLHDEKMSQVVDQYSGMLQRLEPSLSEEENIRRACQQARIHFPELEPVEPVPARNPPKQVMQSKQAHAAGNQSSPAQRINVAPTPPSASQAQANAKAQLRAMRGLNT